MFISLHQTTSLFSYWNTFPKATPINTHKICESAHNKNYYNFCATSEDRSACTSTQSDQSLYLLHVPSTTTGLSKEGWMGTFVILRWLYRLICIFVGYTGHCRFCCTLAHVLLWKCYKILPYHHEYHLTWKYKAISSIVSDWQTVKTKIPHSEYIPSGQMTFMNNGVASTLMQHWVNVIPAGLFFLGYKCLNI